MSKKNKSVLIAGALLVFFVSSSASALDAYQDRRGFYFGFGGLAGVAFEGFEGDDNGFGGGGGLYFGGGATQDFTIEVDIDCLYYTVDPGALTLMAGPRASYFVYEGLYLRIGADFGWFHTDASDEMGAGAEAGLGYEVFFNANAAGSLGLKYEHVFVFELDDIDFIGMTVEMRWY